MLGLALVRLLRLCVAFVLFLARRLGFLFAFRGGSAEYGGNVHLLETMLVVRLGMRFCRLVDRNRFGARGVD